jgi:hypothetical protein
MKRYDGDTEIGKATERFNRYRERLAAILEIRERARQRRGQR